jgi:hypothetical protein
LEILQEEELLGLIFKSYSANPRGWKFIVSPAARNSFYDAVIAGRDEAWRLKFDTIFKPNPIVLGARIDPVGGSVPEISDFNPSFGYRRFDPDLFFNPQRGQLDTSLLASSLASLETVVPRAGESYVEGPIFLSPTQRPLLNRGVVDVDERLSSELVKRLKSKYLGYG